MPQSRDQLVLQSGQPIPCDNSLDIRDPEAWTAPSACHSPPCLSLGKQSPNKQAGCEGSLANHNVDGTAPLCPVQGGR